MNTIIKQKKYFIKDSELKTIEEDRLNQKDVVKNLNLIIDNTKPPFNVALTGKCGIGKSSIINLLLNKYENDTENYNIEKINVWKEKASIKTILDAKFNKIEDEYNKIEINNANYLIRVQGDRMALNTPIQGTAADIIKIAMNKVYRELKEKHPESKLALQVHDELIIEADMKELNDIRELLVRNMQEAMEMKVRLLVDLNTAENWYDLK